MKNLIKVFGIIAIIAIIGFSMVACGGDDGTVGTGGTGGGGGSERGKWRTSKRIYYNINDGVVGSVSVENDYNYITYSYTSNTNFDLKYTITTIRTEQPTTIETIHETRNGQDYVYTSTGTSDGSDFTTTNTTKYDSATGLVLNEKRTQTVSGNTTIPYEISYTIQLLSDSEGVKTYKRCYETYKRNGFIEDVSKQNYSEYKIQNGKIMEEKRYSSAGVLNYYAKNFYPDNAVIRARFGDNWSYYYGSGSSSLPENISAEFEDLSDSATEWALRLKGSFDNVLRFQSDFYYEKVN